MTAVRALHAIVIRPATRVKTVSQILSTEGGLSRRCAIGTTDDLALVLRYQAVSGTLASLIHDTKPTVVVVGRRQCCLTTRYVRRQAGGRALRKLVPGYPGCQSLSTKER